METENLILREFTTQDFDEFAELLRDKMASEMSIYDEQFPTDDESVRGVLSYYIQSREFFAVVLQSENRLIGFISLNSEGENTRNLGFCIHSAYQNKGYASEAARAAVDYAKNILHVKKLVSGTAEQNIASVKLLDKLGFAVTGKSQVSFASDSVGNPIVFTGLSFERVL